MELQSINLRRSSYGADKGCLSGTMIISTQDADINMKLSGETANKILILIADDMANEARNVADNITKEIIEYTPVLEDKSDEV